MKRKWLHLLLFFTDFFPYKKTPKNKIVLSFWEITNHICKIIFKGSHYLLKYTQDIDLKFTRCDHCISNALILLYTPVQLLEKKVWEHQKWVWYNESKKVSGSLDEGYNCYINRILTDFAI